MTTNLTPPSKKVPAQGVSKNAVATASFTLNYIIIEDVELQREYLKSWIEAERPDLHCVAVFSNHLAAYHFLMSEKNPSVNLIFLDIELPGQGDGLTLLKQLHENYVQKHGQPKVIIISGNDYMLKILQQIYTVSSYIFKPIDENELNEAINKVVAEFKPNPIPPPVLPQRKYLEFGGVRIPMKDIMFFESRNNDKILHRKGEKEKDEEIMERMSMDELEKKLPRDRFMRIHESYIVNVNTNYLHTIDKKRTFYTLKCPIIGQKHPIPISQKYRDKFEDTL